MATNTAPATTQASAAPPVARLAKKEARQPKPLPAPNSDFYQIVRDLERR